MSQDEDLMPWGCEGGVGSLVEPLAMKCNSGGLILDHGKKQKN